MQVHLTGPKVMAQAGFAVREEGENPKFEARNSKKYPMTQIQMTKTVGDCVSVLKIGRF
jgi:hypothetical protein